MEKNQDIDGATEKGRPKTDLDASNSSTSKARLLLVEDHDVNQILIQAMTKRLGYETELAEDGTEAVTKVTQSISDNNPFDLVLMDIQMPLMDGYEATRVIRANGVSADTLPIIAITANAFADDIRNCLEAGMQAHISKPVDISNLEAALQEWLPPKRADSASPATKAAQDDLSEDLVTRYAQRKEETVRSFEAFVNRGTFSDREIIEIREELHKLAGTAAMFGDPALGDQARLIEDGLKLWTIAERPQKLATALTNLMEAANINEH